MSYSFEAYLLPIRIIIVAGIILHSYYPILFSSHTHMVFHLWLAINLLVIDNLGSKISTILMFLLFHPLSLLILPLLTEPKRKRKGKPKH